MSDDQTEALRDLHETLKVQNVLLQGILDVMCPMSEFAKSARVIMKFGAWLIATGVMIGTAFQIFGDFFIKHK